MTYNIKEKVKKLKNYDISEQKKIEFIEKLYKLANVCYDLYKENGQTKTNK